ncbi:hypothetical protein BGY98DRAFT_16950 [Russula aff. rugulosa BPL654]|nr:hypothetical protein BGY98DRAFT_16950 [Russula aff. rugulosa BPL654]
MYTGSLTSWGGTSFRFSVQKTHCGCCYCSIICPEVPFFFFGSRLKWPLTLIVSVESEQKEYCYTPRSDFHVSIEQSMFLLVEVQSDKNKSDRYRMLLQAACAARLGRHLYNDLFIVVALYIQNSSRVTRYFVFQPDGANRRVSYVEDIQNWMQPSHLFIALFQLYNLASVIKRDRPQHPGMRDCIRSLNQELEAKLKDAYTSKRMHETSHTSDHTTDNSHKR